MKISQKRRMQLRAACKRYRERHRVLCLKRVRQYRKTHKLQIAAWMRKYRKKHPAKFKQYEQKRKRPLVQRLRFNKYRRRWTKLNPDKIREYYQRRRAALGRNNTLTAQEIREQRNLQQGLCWYCKAKLDNKGNGTIDHKLALSKGGTNCKENIVIACLQCNLKKLVSDYATFRSNRK